MQVRFKTEQETTQSWVRLNPLHTAAELEEIMHGQPVEEPRQPKKDTPQKEKDDPADKKRKASKIEDTLKDFFEKRRGFANYYFNRFELDRILKPTANGPLRKTDKLVWTWSGKITNENSAYSLVLKSDGILSTVGEQTLAIDSRLGWANMIESKSLHGPSLGIRLWQGWNTVGPRAMGEATYIGTTAVVGQSQLMDLTLVTVGEVEAFFYSNPTDGQLVCIELEAQSA